MYPAELRYSREHEWARAEAGGTAVVGITHYAQEQLGDIVYVDLPAVGTKVEQFAKFGEIESVKAVNDLFSPLSGEVVAVNTQLKEKPELVNGEPYGEGWMLRVRMRDARDLGNLMTAQTYEQMVKDAEAAR